MARVKFYKIINSNLSSLPISEGQLIFVQDTGKLYIDKDNSTRVQVDGINYTGTDGITVTNKTITNSGVRAIETGATNGTISVNTNGTSTEISVAGLGDLAFLDEISTSDITTGTLSVERGGTGASTLALGEVLVGNGTSAVQTRAIDTTDGGTVNSTSLITSGAVKAGLETKLNTSLKGANSGLAELDANGKVPSSQLPSYVDDVLEYPSLEDFPATGETGKIYVATDTNKTYRWSGSTYVVISETLALGETDSTAYRGDRGKIAYDHATDGSRLTTATATGLYKVGSTAEGHISGLTAITKADITGLGIPEEDTNTTYTLKQDATDEHKIIFTPSTGSATEITLPDSDTTYTFASGDNNGQIKVTPLNGTASNISVTGLDNAAYKDVDTNIAAGSQSVNLPTSKAVAGFVEGKGYTATSYTPTLESGAEVGRITIDGTTTTLYAPEPGAVSTELATANQTYYLTGVKETTASGGSQIYNTRLSNTFTGLKYQTATSAQGGTLTVDDREVTLGLYYTIA